MPSLKTITSAQNDLVKKIASLRQKKYRDQHGLFMVEGARSVEASLKSGLYALRHACFNAASEKKHLSLIKSAQKSGAECVLVSAKIMEKLSGQNNPQDVIGVYAQNYADARALCKNAKKCLMVLDDIRDPGNLGTIIRTADALALDGIILPDGACDLFSPESVRATMDSIFHVPVARCEKAVLIENLRQNKIRLIGTDGGAEKDFRDVSYAAPFALAMGGEQNGLSPDLAKACQHIVRLPMPGKAESLNLAVAAGVMLYAALAPWDKR